MPTSFKRNPNQNGANKPHFGLKRQKNKPPEYSSTPTRDFLIHVSVVVLVVLIGLGLFLGGRWLWQEYNRDEIENTATTSSQPVNQEQSPIVVKPTISVPESPTPIEIVIEPAEDISDTGVLPEEIAWQTVLAVLFIAASGGLSRKLAHDSRQNL